MNRFKFWRKLKSGTWYKHQFTNDATELGFSPFITWWARHSVINRYSKIIKTETY